MGDLSLVRLKKTPSSSSAAAAGALGEEVAAMARRRNPLMAAGLQQGLAGVKLRKVGRSSASGNGEEKAAAATGGDNMADRKADLVERAKKQPAVSMADLMKVKLRKTQSST